MSEAPNTCARCGGTTYTTVLRGLPMDKCTQCGAVTLSESDLHEVVGQLDTEDAPTEWAPGEPATEVLHDRTQASEEAPTSVRPSSDLPFDIESQPPPPRRQQRPESEPVEFSAPPMLTEDFELPRNLADVDRTEEAPKLAMPVTGSALMGEPQIDLSSLREASAPAPREPAPGPESDFNDTPTRPSYPMEGTLEPADEVGPYLLHREERRQTRVYVAIGVMALLAIAGIGALAVVLMQGPLGGEPSRDAALSEVITPSNGRVAIEVEEPSVADVLPPEPERAPEPVIRVSKAEQPAPPTRAVVRRPVPVVVPVTAPAPSASPEAPAPQPAAGGSYSSLVQQGWSTVSGDPASAASAFARALSLRTGDPEASYGLGYALWRQERQSEALPHLCLALRNGGLDTQREVNGLLARSDLSCD